MSLVQRLRGTLDAVIGAGPASREGVRAHAQALVTERRYGDAIAYATAENRRLADAELEQSLVRWRHDGFAEQPTPAKPDWPPSISDPFPDADATPQIVGAQALTSERLGGAILHHGCLIVRGLFSPTEVQQLKSGIDKALDALQRTKQNAALPGDAAWYAPIALPDNSDLNVHGRYFVEDDHGVWTADSPRMLFTYLDMIKAKGIDKVIGGYLGEAPATSVGKSTLRRLPPRQRPGDWHQDGAFLGTSTRSVNLWLALSHCGEDASGLDMVPRRLNDLVQTNTEGAKFDWTVGHPLAVEAARGRSIASPIFEPGDAVFFDHLFLHRTAGHPNQTNVRYAIENWFFAPSAFPTMQEGLLL